MHLFICAILSGICCGCGNELVSNLSNIYNFYMDFINDMKNNRHKKVTFEDKFYRFFCRGKINHEKTWAKDKRTNSKLCRTRSKRELEKEIEDALDEDSEKI